MFNRLFAFFAVILACGVLTPIKAYSQYVVQTQAPGYWDFYDTSVKVANFANDLIKGYEALKYQEANLASGAETLANIAATINMLGGSNELGATFKSRLWGATNELIHQCEQFKNIKFGAEWAGVSIEPDSVTAVAMGFDELYGRVAMGIEAARKQAAAMSSDMADLSRNSQELGSDRGLYAPNEKIAAKISARALVETGRWTMLLAKAAVAAQQTDLSNEYNVKLAEDKAKAKAEAMKYAAAAKAGEYAEAYAAASGIWGALTNKKNIETLARTERRRKQEGEADKRLSELRAEEDKILRERTTSGTGSSDSAAAVINSNDTLKTK